MLLIFDLDGTLIDSAQDLALATNATRTQVGLSELDPALINTYVGNGAAVLVRRALPSETPEPELQDALRFFLQYYGEHALAHTKLYAGVGEVIEQLHGRGHTLAVLTNKPHRISLDILNALNVAGLFARVYGGDSFADKKPKPTGILALLRELNVEASQAWMIGDSAVDVQTARNARVRACGVGWGFQPDSFAVDAPDALVRTPGELLQVLV